MQNSYNDLQQIYRIKYFIRFLPFYKGEVSPKKNNKIILDLANKIREYEKDEKSREINIKYKQNSKSRIIKAKMVSLDGIFKGEIEYRPPCGIFNIGFGASIHARIYSYNFDDQKEYLNLIKIIETSGLKRRE